MKAAPNVLSLLTENDDDMLSLAEAAGGRSGSTKSESWGGEAGSVRRSGVGGTRREAK